MYGCTHLAFILCDLFALFQLARKIEFDLGQHVNLVVGLFKLPQEVCILHSKFLLRSIVVIEGSRRLIQFGVSLSHVEMQLLDVLLSQSLSEVEVALEII